MPICGGFPKKLYILQENGDRIALESGKGFLLLEDQDIGKTSSPWKARGSVFLLFAIGEFIRQLFYKG